MIGPAIRDKPFSSVLRRGIERGELPSPASLDVALDLLVGSMVTRILVTGDVVDERYVRETVWTVLAGLVAIFETP